MAEPSSVPSAYAAPPWRPPASLRGLLTVAWAVPGDSADLAARLRDDQWRAAVNQLPTSALATAIAVLLLLACLPPSADLGPLTPTLWALVALNSFNFGLWWHERGRAQADPGRRRGARAALLLALDLFIGGVLDAVLVLQAAQQIPPSMQAPLVAAVSGAIAAAAWMFALLPAVSLAWVLGACGTLGLGILLGPLAWMTGLLPLLPLFALVLALAALVNARLFLQGRQAQHEAARDRLTVSLLLRDFEQHASDWLWEVNREGRLRHVSSRLAERLGQPVTALIDQRLTDVLASCEASRGCFLTS